MLVQQSGASSIFALRFANWKYISQPNKPAELYDLSADPAERTNVADSQPERAAALRERLIGLVGEERLKAPPAKAAKRKRN